MRSPLTVSKFRFAFISWWLVWSFLQILLIMNFGFSFRIAFIDSIISNVLVAEACWLSSNILRYYLPQKEKYWYILFLTLGLTALIVFSIRYLLRWILSSETAYLSFASASWPIRLGIVFLLIGCMTIMSVLWYTIEEEQEVQKRKVDAERLAKEAELYKLRQQLQPHFLFNSLNSINALIGSQPEQARKMIHQLSDFLRVTLKKEEQQWVSLSEELQNLQLYLDIEKLRFGHRLSTTIESNEDCQPLKLPSLLLQPLVENAIKFGLYDTTGDITIYIQATCTASSLTIIIQNPFDPETSYPKQGTGFGLTSVRRRLHLLFARNDLLDTKTEGNLFITTVTIPQT